MTPHDERIEIYDTTLRDGTQGEGFSLSLEDKLLIADALDALGVDYIEGGYPRSNPKDEAFFAAMKERTLTRATLTAFGMTRRRDTAVADDAGMGALLASGAPCVTLVGKSWDLHVREVLRVSEDENVRMIGESVGFLTGAGRECLYDAEHFFDGWHANRAYVLRTLRAALDAGAACLILCDTNGGSTMEQIAEAVDQVRAELPDARFGIHCHNDCDLAVANSLTAVAHGVRQVQGTINGIGERCGNADLVSVIANLAIKHGRNLLRGPESLRHLTETSRFVYEVANLNLREGQPFVGSAAFAHKGGMHVHAVRRNAATYEHIQPEQVGNARRILVSELSGLSNIAALAGAKFGIADDRDAQKRILRRVMELESQGYQFDAAEASFDVLVRKTLGGSWYRSLWELDHYRCVIYRREETLDAQRMDVDTEAIVKLSVHGTMRHTVAEGDGPVDSLHTSLCAALREDYPQVDQLHLRDYKVRVVNTAAETAAKVRVMIDWYDQTDSAYFGSVGVSENIIHASWLALVDAVEYKLLKERKDAP